MNRIAIIDGDTPIFVAAYYNRDQEEVEGALLAVDGMITEILLNTGAEKYTGFIKGLEPSHRHKMFADYKGNRPPAPEWLIKWRPAIEKHLIDQWKFEYVNGMEVDDAVASAFWLVDEAGSKHAEKLEELFIPVICSVDKDFNQLPGLHYNPKTKEIKDITSAEAYLFLATQLLTGDSTDNIKGIPGVGPATAKKILQGDGITAVHQPLERVIGEYMNYHKDITIGLLDFAENAVKIILKVDKYFKFALNDVPESIKQLQKKEIPL